MFTRDKLPIAIPSATSNPKRRGSTPACANARCRYGAVSGSTTVSRDRLMKSRELGGIAPAERELVPTDVRDLQARIGRG